MSGSDAGSSVVSPAGEDESPEVLRARIRRLQVANEELRTRLEQHIFAGVFREGTETEQCRAWNKARKEAWEKDHRYSVHVHGLEDQLSTCRLVLMRVLTEHAPSLLEDASVRAVLDPEDLKRLGPGPCNAASMISGYATDTEGLSCPVHMGPPPTVAPVILLTAAQCIDLGLDDFAKLAGG